MDFTVNTWMSDLLTVETLSLNGTNFKQWQQKIHFALDNFKVGFILYESIDLKINNQERNEIETIGSAKITLNSMSNDLYDVYCKMDNYRKIQDTLNQKYVTEDVGTKKYTASNFLKFEMIDKVSMSSQIVEYRKILSETSSEGLKMK